MTASLSINKRLKHHFGELVKGFARAGTAAYITYPPVPYQFNSIDFNSKSCVQFKTKSFELRFYGLDDFVVITIYFYQSTNKNCKHVMQYESCKLLLKKFIKNDVYDIDVFIGMISEFEDDFAEVMSSVGNQVAAKMKEHEEINRLKVLASNLEKKKTNSIRDIEEEKYANAFFQEYMLLSSKLKVLKPIVNDIILSIEQKHKKRKIESDLHMANLQITGLGVSKKEYARKNLSVTPEGRLYLLLKETGKIK